MVAWCPSASPSPKTTRYVAAQEAGQPYPSVSLLADPFDGFIDPASDRTGVLEDTITRIGLQLLADTLDHLLVHMLPTQRFQGLHYQATLAVFETPSGCPTCDNRT